MRQEKITLILASLALALLANCGNANMSGAVGPRKEKTDKSGARKASSPAVVTGTYLTCDYSPIDDTENREAVGCSMMANGSQVAPTPENKLAFYSSFQNGAYKDPAQSSTLSGHQALFLAPKGDAAKTRYFATIDNRYGIDEISCDKLPCQQPVTRGAKPSFVKLQVDGIWRMDKGFNWTTDTRLLNFIEPSLFCEKKDGVRKVKVGTNPASNFFPPLEILRVFGGGLSGIENLGQLYALRENFGRRQLEGKLGDDPKYFEANENCIVVPLTKKSSEGFPANGMTKSGPHIDRKSFYLILLKSDSSSTNDDLTKTVKGFINDIL